MMPKLLTVVVPTYNLENLISRCLESVTDERIPDTLEVIVVNDGSKDNSLKVIREFESKRPDIIKVIDKQNGHYGSCVNAGLSAATGKYLRMLDADDWFDTEALLELLKRLETCDTDLFITLRTEITVKKDNSVTVKKFPFEGIEYGKEYQMQDFDIDAHAVGREFNMHSMAYKTEVLRKVGLKHIEGICYTDIQYCFLPIDRIKTFVVFDLYLYQYFRGRDDQSTSDRSLVRNFSHIEKVLLFILDYMDKHPYPKDSITLKNQKYFLLEAYVLFLISLRWQSGFNKEEYSRVSRILRSCSNYGLTCALRKKWYYRTWYMLKSRITFNSIFAFYHTVHFKKKRKFK